MRNAMICAVLAALLLLAGCQVRSGAADPASSDPTSELDWIKECFFEYLKSDGLVDPEFGPKDASDLTIGTYVGTFGDGCVVAYVDVPGLNYPDAYRSEQYGTHTITFRDGQPCYAFSQNNVYTIGEAYDKGLLSDADILEIDAAVGIHEQ